ncbi:MAG: PrsW family glutamic-type intramembrane protease [Xenococcaceae cyanobacterium]
MVENVVLLRQLSTGGVAGKLIPPYRFTGIQEIVIGRDHSCQVSLDPHVYTGVSRRHAVIRPPAEGVGFYWEICDLNSANGTYVNGQRLHQWQILQSGDRIALGHNGPEFIIEYQNQNNEQTAPPRSSTSRQPDSLTFTQLFPIASTGRDLSKKAYLVPGIFTVIFVVLMFASVGKPVAFNLLLAGYLAGAAYYYVYRLCGKPKPWWVLFGSGLATVVILLSPLLPLFIFVFRDILPGNLPSSREQVNFFGLLISMFFGAGLMEELLKALPVLGAYFIGSRLSSPWRERIGVCEPLDAILLGTASAVGFTLLETLGQYVPDIINNVTLQAGEGTGQLLGLQLLIPRILGSVAGHMAYSGYLGYFIGLSVLKPSKRWRILLVGYLTASFLHALWNTTGFYNNFLLAAVGGISYAFLAAAILKARALSPTRSQNFATRFYNNS